MANNGMMQKVYIGITVALACAIICGWVTITGDVRANTITLMHFQRRADKIETAMKRHADNLSEIRADIREIKTILERAERDRMEKD